MKTNLKISVASLALVAIFSGGVGVASADGGMMSTQSTTQASTVMTQDANMAAFLTNLAVFLKNVDAYIENQKDGGMSMEEPTTDTPAADLRVVMNNLFSEHVTVSASVMRNIIDESNDLNGSKEAQMSNAVEIAEAFGSLYGNDVQKAVAEAFVEHVEFSNEYAQAVDDMDEDAKEAADEELDEYLRDIAVLLSSVIDSVDEDTVYTVLRQHEDLLNEAAEQYKNGDFEEAYETEREALKQIQTVSDVLSQGIVDTMPEDF